MRRPGRKRSNGWSRKVLKLAHRPRDRRERPVAGPMIVSLIRRVFERGGSRRPAEGIVVGLDAEGRVVSASKSFERRLGYSPHEGLHLSIADIVHPEDIAAARGLL